MKKMRWSVMAVLAGSCLLTGSLGYGQAASPGTRVLLNPNRGTMNPNRGTMMEPPATMAGCRVKTLQMLFRTGNDDLRGGANNLNVEIHFAGGRMQEAKNVNGGLPWKNYSQHTVVIPLNPEVAPMDIKQIRLVHLAQGSYHGPAATPLVVLSPEIAATQGIQSEDNWHMTEFEAMASSSTEAFNSPNMTAAVIPIASYGAFQFTGSVPDLLIPARTDVRCPVSGQVRQLQLRFRTANDDLRGGNDNLNLSIHYADGTQQAVLNVNQSQRWADGSMHSVEVMLDRSVTLDQIKALTLETTFGGGVGGDNWNMESLDIMAFVDGKMQQVITAGFHKFSADMSGPKARSITIALK